MIPLAARRRAMLAAEAVEVSTMREAAIVGGVVRCVIACGRANGPWIAEYAADIIRDFNIQGVDRSVPTLAEVSVVFDRFQQSYSYPLG